MDNLAILGECSLRRLWIELRFPPAQNINLDQFVKDVETHTKNEKITKRTDPATGVIAYSKTYAACIQLGIYASDHRRKDADDRSASGKICDDT